MRRRSLEYPDSPCRSTWQLRHQTGGRRSTGSDPGTCQNSSLEDPMNMLRQWRDSRNLPGLAVEPEWYRLDLSMFHRDRVGILAVSRLVMSGLQRRDKC